MVQLMSGLIPNHRVKNGFTRVGHGVLNFTFFGQVIVVDHLFVGMRLILVIDPVNDGRDLFVFSQPLSFFLEDIDELVNVFSYHVVLIIEFS